MSEESENTKYKVYLEQRQALIDLEVDASNRLDRGILTFSGGALGLSITFIEKIAPHPQPCTIWLLGFSWLLLLATLLVSLCSHLTSQSAMRRQREILDLELESESLTKEQKRNSMSTCTHCLNIASMITFSIGVILLCAFTIANLPKGDVLNDKKPDRQTHNRCGRNGGSQPSKTETNTTTNIAKEGEMIVTDKNSTNQAPKATVMDGVVAPNSAKLQPPPQPSPKKKK